jgi:aminopeptidase-like protein
MSVLGAAASSCPSPRSESLTDGRPTGVAWDLIRDPAEPGAEIYRLIEELYPICRSISGDGVRRTFDIVDRVIPIVRTEVPTGTQVLDWTVPREWNIREAWIDAPDGTRVVDLRDSCLHVLGYSTPIRKRLPLTELREHLFVHATDPDLIPFRTSYYNENWGFCLTRRTLDGLADGDYEVCIDSTLADGSITYAEALLPGATDDEILFSTYSCHPSLANENVSGIAFLAVLAKYLSTRSLHYSYRMLWSPGSIGPISWLAGNEERLPQIRGGLVATCLGDPGQMTYKRSRQGHSEIDRAVAVALRDTGNAHELRDFVPLGGDERQFCSPGINLAMGALSRTPADEFPEYHSSADNLDLVQPACLADSFAAFLRVIDILERNAHWQNTSPKGEPQLGKRGLYRTIGGGSSQEAALLWVLNLSDGDHDLLEIADRSRCEFPTIADAARLLQEHDLLARAGPTG